MTFYQYSGIYKILKLIKHNRSNITKKSKVTNAPQKLTELRLEVSHKLLKLSSSV